MAILDEDSLDPSFKSAISDRLNGWELVEFLDIPIEDIVELFEEEILDNIEEIKELIGFTIETEEND